MQAGQPAAEASAHAVDALGAAGFVVDYVEVRAPDLSAYVDGQQAAVALAAARLGATRLIDNLEFSLDGTPTAR